MRWIVALGAEFERPELLSLPRAEQYTSPALFVSLT